LGPDCKVYAIGGSQDNGTTALNTVERYDTSFNAWTTSPPLAHLLTARDAPGAALGADARIYVFGGSSDGVSPAFSSVESYSNSPNPWGVGAGMNPARAGAAGVQGPDGRVYALGGVDNSGTVLASVEAFNTATHTWTPAVGPGSIAPMPAVRF